MSISGKLSGLGHSFFAVYLTQAEQITMAETFTFTVNGKPTTITTERDRSLLEVIREDLQLTGTHYGCGEGACGACSVLLDGKRIFSCATPVYEIEGKGITTIEALANGEKLHPVQQAFMDESALQCAYCASGMIMATVALLGRKSNPSEAEIIEGMNGNLCRCCGYEKIVGAVKKAVQLSGRSS
jgi:aerobic-type carbon monoxide dehydrogenase small subunit (CoxS/CutS family)